MTSHYHDAAIEASILEYENEIYRRALSVAEEREWRLIKMDGSREFCTRTLYRHSEKFKEPRFAYSRVNAACERLVG